MAESGWWVGYKLDVRGCWFDSWKGQVRYLSFMAFRSFLGLSQTPVQWVPGVKRLGREGNQLPPHLDVYR